MVQIVKDWGMLKEYAQSCRVGTFQVREAVEGVEIRVHVGRFGYVTAFKDPKDTQLQRIKAFCEKSGFLEIVGAMEDETFFR